MINVRACLAALLACAMCAPVFAHPHNGDIQTLVLRGTITDIDLKNGTLALDGIDRETKTLTGRLTKAQRRWIETLTAAGADAAVWTPSSWPEIEDTIGGVRRGRI